MSLASLAAQAIGNGPEHQECAVCHALRTIPADEAEALRILLRSTMRYSEISALIADDPDTPLVIDQKALGRHARAGCSARESLRPLKGKR